MVVAETIASSGYSQGFKIRDGGQCPCIIVGTPDPVVSKGYKYS